MRVMRAILWILGSIFMSKVVGNFIFEVLNPPGTGVNLVTAFIPALFSAGIFAFGAYKAFFERPKTDEFAEKTSDVKVKTGNLVKNNSAKIPSMEDAYQTVVDSVKSNISKVRNNPTTQVNDDALWEKALVELDEGAHKKGLWAKCFSQANGDENIAKANYLKMRVAELKSESSEQMPETISCPACHTTNLRTRDDCVSCKYDLRALKRVF